ncbi:MAG TPA: epimerase [Deferribacteraceae bacterium]|nr:epimerase [Deferribacteraceae bacterium]
MNKKVLLFGADSFTGFHLKKHLEILNYEVFGTSVVNRSEYIYCDLLNKDNIKNVLNKIKPEYIINLAAISFVAHDDTLDFYKINILGVQNILDAIVDTELRPYKVILPSSAVVYGNTGGVIGEDLLPKPVNHYGISKYGMELMAENYFDKINIIISRPFNYTGKMQNISFVIPKIFSAFQNGEQVVKLGNLDTVREYNDVRMIADIYAKLMVSDNKGETVNICSGRGYSLQEVIKACEKIFNYKIGIETDERFIRKNEIKSLIGSPDKLKKIIGEYKVFSIDEILGSML